MSLENSKIKAKINYNKSKDKYELRVIKYFFDSNGSMIEKRSLFESDYDFDTMIIPENAEIPCIDLDAFTLNGKIISRSY